MVLQVTQSSNIISSVIVLSRYDSEVEGMVVEEEEGGVKGWCDWLWDVDACVYVLLAFGLKAGGSALILLNHDLVPVPT